MNQQAGISTVTCRMAFAAAILVLSAGWVLAQGSLANHGAPETCADYHQFTAPDVLDSSSNPSSAGVPRWSELRVDSQGYFHIAYLSPSGVLMYGSNRGGAFHSEPVSISSGMKAPSLALDANDKAHIVYGNDDNYLWYKTNASGSWSAANNITVIAAPACESSLSFDRSGVLHVLYMENDSVTYATWRGGFWSRVCVNSQCDSPVRPTLVFAPDNKATMSYASTSNGVYSLYMQQANADGSNVQQPEKISEADPYSLSMAIDGQGAIYIAYLTVSFPNNLWVKVKYGSVWQGLLDGTQYQGNMEGTSIGANIDGSVFIAYNSNTYPDHAKMVVIPATGCGAHYSAMVKAGENCHYPRINASRPGKAHILYADVSYVLKHAETFVAAPACTLSCSASASPATGEAPLVVNFASTVAPSENCSGSPSYSWAFGDGQTSAEQNASHTYAKTGNFNWTFTATQDGASCNKSGRIVVTGPGGLPGDCDGNGTVTIGEVQKVINAFLGLGGECK